MMMTATTEIRETTRTTREVTAAKTNAAVPRHVAMVLNSGAGRQALHVDAATSALRAIVLGCSEAGVTVLTLIRPDDCAESFDAAVAAVRATTETVNALRINLASPRSGRDELVESVRRIAAQAKRGGVAPGAIGSEQIESGLSTRGLPPIDLLITTGGGATLSGALVWQAAYAELLFLDAPWQSFSRADFEVALADYSKRCRKFGGLA
ncbi:MAG: undecaprenyl diphosphate synthase family protein [Planctomycetota bacterium]